MDQPKKPARDISDLKARLGLAKSGAAPAPGAPMPMPGSAPSYQQPAPMPAPGGWQQPGAPGPMAAPQPAPAHDPFASLKPAGGRAFDLDDGRPVENVRQKGGKGGLVVGAILLILGLGVGGGFGGAAIGRKAFNNANLAAKLIQAELDDISKHISKLGEATILSAQRSQQAGDPMAFDYKFVEDLEAIDLTKRPSTARIFKADYYRLEDNLLDRLMNYYYDATALYREAEDHVRRTKNDKAALETAAKKTAEKQTGVNYGIIYLNTGNLLVGNLVEVGAPVCKDGGAECTPDKIDSFQVRASSGASWMPRKIGTKPDIGNVVPIKPTDLFEAVMTGSPEQVLMSEYRGRVSTIRTLVTRLGQSQKELVDTVNKAAGRQDLFSLF